MLEYNITILLNMRLNKDRIGLITGSAALLLGLSCAPTAIATPTPTPEGTLLIEYKAKYQTANGKIFIQTREERIHRGQPPPECEDIMPGTDNYIFSPEWGETQPKIETGHRVSCDRVGE